MTLRKCPGCPTTLTTSNVVKGGRIEGIIYVTCKKCFSTSIILSKVKAVEYKAWRAKKSA